MKRPVDVSSVKRAERRGAVKLGAAGDELGLAFKFKSSAYHRSQAAKKKECERSISRVGSVGAFDLNLFLGGFLIAP